jgi:hypothetical protein
MFPVGHSDRPAEQARDEVDIPPYGALSEGITGPALLEAIKKSGYPFQAEVVDVLSSELSRQDIKATLQEEWPYVDSDGNTPRSLDIYAQMSVPTEEVREGKNGTTRGRIRVAIDLLVECKQSSYPFVFFLRNGPFIPKARHPEIVGLPHEKLRIFSPSDSLNDFSFMMPIHDVLGSFDLSFCSVPTPFAVSFAKAMRKGSRLELTGEETYRSITLPLMKAADHLKLQYKPNPKTSHTGRPRHYSMHFVVCVAVVRAPMIGTFLSNGKNHLISLPWVRSARMDPADPDHWPESNRTRYFDVVHIDYFSSYLQHIVRDLTELARRAKKIDGPMADGYGFEVASKTEAPTESEDPNEEHIYKKLIELPEEFQEHLNVETMIEISHTGGQSLT